MTLGALHAQAIWRHPRTPPVGIGVSEVLWENTTSAVSVQTNSVAAKARVMKPDFSGEWILDRQASALSSNAAAFQTGLMRIEHRDPIFRFQLCMVAGDKPVEHAGEGLTDGKEVAGEGALTRLYWDGDMLVMSCEPQSGDAQWAMSFRYELLDEGRRLRWSEQIRGGGRDQENTWMFERRREPRAT